MLSNNIGKRVAVKKTKDTSFRYFLRTSTRGGALGDTSNLSGYYTDFIYDHDKTCNSNVFPRMLSNNLKSVFERITHSFDRMSFSECMCSA